MYMRLTYEMTFNSNLCQILLFLKIKNSLMVMKNTKKKKIYIFHKNLNHAGVSTRGGGMICHSSTVQ